VIAVSGHHRILSEPVRLHWAGWESDTRRLQQAGWAISAEQDIPGATMRLAMRHEGCHIQGLTDRVPWSYMQETDFRVRPPLVLPVRFMASRFHVELIETPSICSFRPIDAQPQFTRSEIRSLDDLAHFAVPLARTQEIVLPEESVPELLERILKLQQPARTDRIRRQLREEAEVMRVDAIPQQRFHAQILSFAA
jgi:hypothetical protein